MLLRLFIKLVLLGRILIKIILILVLKNNSALYILVYKAGEIIRRAFIISKIYYTLILSVT